jgi:hypothetical protein
MKCSLKELVLALALLLAAWCAGGCASVPYTYGADRDGPNIFKAGEPQISRGKPYALLDGLGHYVISLPGKLLLWNWDLDRHHISPETEAALVQYLAHNGLDTVKVRLNEYAPGGEWRRLVKNKSVGWFYRYTVGAVTVALYTILPGRLLGGDHYNPFTNTVNIFSDDPAILLHEAGHAKDLARRKWKGTYATLRAIPLVPLYNEAVATGDAIGYTIDQQQPEAQKNAYKTLYPAYGTYVSGEVGAFFPLSTLERFAVALAGAIPGHIAGRLAAARVEDEPAPAAEATAAPATTVGRP